MLYVLFGIGFILQLVFQIGPHRLSNRSVAVKLGASVFVGLLLGLYFLIVSDNHAERYDMAIDGMCVGIVVSANILLRKYLLRTIGPAQFVLWGMLCCYAAYGQFSPAVYFGFLCIVLGLASFVTEIDRNNLVKLLHYVLYLSLVCSVAWFGGQGLSAGGMPFTGTVEASSGPLGAFSFGMALCIIWLNLAFLISLIPGRDNSLADVKNTIRVYIRNYREDTAKHHPYLLVLVLCCLLLNYRFSVVRDGTILSLAIAASQLLSPRLPGQSTTKQP